MNIPTKILAVVAASFFAANANAETIYGVTVSRDLVTFDSANPATILTTKPITGLTSQDQFESVRKIDFRPATGQLYAVGNAPGGIYRLYTIDINDGKATRIGGNVLLNPISGSFGFNFEPLFDQIRIVTDDDQNLGYSPSTAALVATGSPLAYVSGDVNFGVNPTIVTASFTTANSNGFMWSIDRALGVFAYTFQDEVNQGALRTGPGNAVGISLPNYIDGVNLEFSQETQRLYVALSDPGTGHTNLYEFKNDNNGLILLGEVGSGLILNGIAITLPPAQALPQIASISKTGPSLPGGSIRFTAATDPGLSVRIQSSATPNDEGSWTDLPGGNMTENDPSNPGAGNYTLDTTAYPHADGIFFRAISSKQGFTDGKSDFLGPYDLRVPTAPPHGGLSPTFFAVNGSFSPTSGVADTVLRFGAVQTDTAAGLIVRVQARVGNAGTWTDLPNGDNGHMTLDPANNQFVLHSTNYPLQNGVHFRALSSANSYSDSISNEVGPFDLATNKPHLGPPLLFITANGPVADLYFLAAVATVPNGISLRIQSTTTPTDETSWTNLNHSSQGQMQRSTNPDYPRQFLLLVNNHPAAEDLFFRTVASLSGSVDSISAPSGPFTLVANTPPKVTINPKTTGLPGSGSEQDPIIVSAGTTFLFEVKAESSRPIRSLRVQIDGSTFGEFSPGTTRGDVEFEFTTSAVGDRRVLEAVAVDDLGATARAGTAPLYVRVLPATTSNAGKANDIDSASSADAGAAVGKFFTVAINNGVWTDPATWRDQNGNPGVPGPNDVVSIEANTIRFGFDGEARSVGINGGKLVGSAILHVYGQLTIVGATIEGPMTLKIESGATAELLNSSNIQFNPDSSGFRGDILNLGTCNIHGSAGIVGTRQLVNLGTINFQTPLSIPPNPETNPAAGIRPIPRSGNSGLLTSSSNLLTRGNTTFVVTLIGDGGGTLIGHDGATLIGDGGGTIVAGGGGNVVSNDGAGLIGQDAAALIGDGGGTIVGAGGGNLIGHDGATFLPGAGNIPSAQERTASESDDYTQSAGETNLDGIRIIGSVAIDGGSLTGSGLIAGNVTNNGFILPGNSAGGISILGNYTQGAQGSLIIENGGPNAGQYDQLQVGGVATLNGKLQVRTINGYVPDAADTFNPLGYKSVSGTFASVSGNTQLSFNASGALATVNPAIPNPLPPKALNIATRMRVETGDNVLIAGFIITGSQPKKVIIRGIGPSLPFGGVLADPTLNLDNGAVTNDNWRTNQEQEIIATTIPPSNNLESAIVATLIPGPHTAILGGAGGATGIGVVEVYDLESGSPVQLANIASRGFVQAGDNVMIGGFIIGGDYPAKVLIRAIGPSLPFSGVLQNPTLELVDSNGNRISNDNWRATQETEIVATTIPPTNNNEAAILATLVPGPYTAIVRGKDDTVGIALIEAYNLQ